MCVCERGWACVRTGRGSGGDRGRRARRHVTFVTVTGGRARAQDGPPCERGGGGFSSSPPSSGGGGGGTSRRHDVRVRSAAPRCLGMRPTDRSARRSAVSLDGARGSRTSRRRRRGGEASAPPQCGGAALSRLAVAPAPCSPSAPPRSRNHASQSNTALGCRAGRARQPRSPGERVCEGRPQQQQRQQQLLGSGPRKRERTMVRSGRRDGGSARGYWEKAVSDCDERGRDRRCEEGGRS